MNLKCLYPKGRDKATIFKLENAEHITFWKQTPSYILGDVGEKNETAVEPADLQNTKTKQKQKKWPNESAQNWRN